MNGLEDGWKHFIHQHTTEEKKAQGWTYERRKSKVCQRVISPDGEVITYQRYVTILKRYYFNVSHHLIMGHQFNFKTGMGFLKARRVERNFSKPQINMIATIRNHNNGTPKKVYRIEEDWSRIAYCRPRIDMRIGNVIDPLKKYRFVISRTSGNTKNNASNGGLKNRFIAALDNNPWLKYQYDFYPNNY